MKKLLLALLVFTVSKAYAQLNFNPGYIISIEQDTIYGRIALKGDASLCKFCLFKSENKKITKYLPSEIRAFYIEGIRYYESFEVDGESKFLEMLFKGAVNIYYYTDNNSKQYYIKKEEGGLEPLNYFERSLFVNQRGTVEDARDFDITSYDMSSWNSGKQKVVIRVEQYKKTLDSLMSDTPGMAGEINRLGKVEHKELIAVSQIYHQLKNKNEDYMVYHQNHKKGLLEFSVGLLNIDYSYIKSKNSYMIYGFKGYTPLRGSNLFFGYGLQFAAFKIPPGYSVVEFQQVQIPSINYGVFRIPFSFGYIYPGKVLLPYASVGFNVYIIREKYSFAKVVNHTQPFLPSYSLGLAANVYKNFQLTVNLEGDFWDLNVFSSSKFSQTKNIGLRYRF